MKFTGEFKTHITVRLQDLDSIDRLPQCGIAPNLNFRYISLERGPNVSEPILTRRGRLSLSGVPVSGGVELKIITNISKFDRVCDVS